jgi:hypothetical protein
MKIGRILKAVNSTSRSDAFSGWCGCTDTNAYAYGTSLDERCSWCGVTPNYETDNPSGMPSARQGRTQSPTEGDPPAALAH